MASAAGRLNATVSTARWCAVSRARARVCDRAEADSTEAPAFSRKNRAGMTAARSRHRAREPPPSIASIHRSNAINRSVGPTTRSFATFRARKARGSASFSTAKRRWLATGKRG